MTASVKSWRAQYGLEGFAKVDVIEIVYLFEHGVQVRRWGEDAWLEVGVMWGHKLDGGAGVRRLGEDLGLNFGSRRWGSKFLNAFGGSIAMVVG